MAAYRAAIDADPNLFEAHLDLAMTLRAQNDLDGALREVSVALNIQPRHGLALDFLKVVQAEKQQATSRPTSTGSEKP